MDWLLFSLLMVKYVDAVVPKEGFDGIFGVFIKLLVYDFIVGDCIRRHVAEVPVICYNVLHMMFRVV